jgi:hypothetical protein
LSQDYFAGLAACKFVSHCYFIRKHISCERA